MIASNPDLDVWRDTSSERKRGLSWKLLAGLQVSQTGQPRKTRNMEKLSPTRFSFWQFEREKRQWVGSNRTRDLRTQTSSAFIVCRHVYPRQGRVTSHALPLGRQKREIARGPLPNSQVCYLGLRPSARLGRVLGGEKCSEGVR